MKRVSAGLASGLAGVVCALCTQPADASDWNPLGFYAGAGVGETTVRSDYGFNPAYPVDSHPHHTAYKVLAGIRPLPFVGAEAEYIDFGHPGSSDGYFNGLNGLDFNANSHPKAGVLSAVGYLPLPFIDVFAKVGVARLETNIDTYSQGVCTQISPGGACGPPVLSRQHAWQTKAAYGAGVQAHLLGSLAVRGEYERINSAYGAPDALMLSANWTF